MRCLCHRKQQGKGHPACQNQPLLHKLDGDAPQGAGAALSKRLCPHHPPCPAGEAPASRTTNAWPSTAVAEDRFLLRWEGSQLQTTGVPSAPGTTVHPCPAAGRGIPLAVSVQPLAQPALPGPCETAITTARVQGGVPAGLTGVSPGLSPPVCTLPCVTS